MQDEEEEDQAELEQGEESENLEDEGVGVDEVLVDTEVEGDCGTEVFTFSTAAQTSALFLALAGENGRRLETDYVGEKAYDGHYLPMTVLHSIA